MQDARLVAPDAGEDVVELDVDRREGQEARHQHLRRRLPVPGQRRHLARVPGRTAVRVQGTSPGRRQGSGYRQAPDVHAHHMSAACSFEHEPVHVTLSPTFCKPLHSKTPTSSPLFTDAKQERRCGHDEPDFIYGSVDTQHTGTTLL